MRLRMRRPRRATVVFVEAVLAVAAAAVAVQSVSGYVVAGAALVIGVAGLVRRRGRGLVDVLRDRFRDPVLARQPAAAPTGPDAGIAGSLLPGLHLAEVATRSGPGIAVVGDGQGFAVLLVAEVGSAHRWTFGELVRVLTDDPARPAAAQLLVEQCGPGRDDPDFAPSRTYRALPVAGIPLWNRVLLVIRHEPTWAPEPVATRGGGAIGARNALVAVAARVVAAAAREGTRLRPAGLDEAAALLRELGDPAPAAEVGPEAIITQHGCHRTLSVPLQGEDALGEALRAAAELDVDRSVLSLTANAIDHSACAAVRLVAAEGERPAADRLAAAADRLTSDGIATPLPDAQDAGMIATLPLGGGARSLADLVNQERM